MEEFEAAQGRALSKGHNFKPHLLFTWVDDFSGVLLSSWRRLHRF
jgi:hypothetical protein